MGLHNKRNWLYVLLAASCFWATSNAEIVYQDNFDRLITAADGSLNTVETIPYWPRRESNLDFDVNWYTTYTNLSQRRTNVTAGEGVLTINTEDVNSGVISHTSDTYDFFNQELTYTFEGIHIQALGLSRKSAQWVKFGVVANSDRTFWGSYPLFLVAVSGSGAFSLQVWQENDRESRKEFISNSFNFDVAKLRKVELTMDSTNYRVIFTFEDKFDVLSFGGLHRLVRSQWYVDTVGINGRYGAQSKVDSAERNLILNEEALVAAEATGVQADIDAAQALIDRWQLEYDNAVAVLDAKLLEAEAVTGDSALMVSVRSDVANIVSSMTSDELAVYKAEYNAGTLEIGARVTVDAVTVETTNVLQ